MRPNRIDPEITASFRYAGNKFISRNAGGFLSCPPYVVANVARSKLIPVAPLELPAGYAEATFDQICALTGWVDRDVEVSLRQAAELALIGFQLQEFDDAGLVIPPFGVYEAQNVEHLITSVTGLNFNGMRNYEISEADITFVAAAARQLSAR